MSVPTTNRDPVYIESLIPKLESDVFSDSPDSRFWVGYVALEGGEVVDPGLYEAVKNLRKNVYVDEKRYLSAEEVDGSLETDDDDFRATHIAVVENGAFNDHGLGVVSVNGTSRLTLKRSETDLLPAETIYPDVYKDNPASVGALEAGRYISRHTSPRIQHMGALAEIRWMAATALHGEGEVHAVVEEDLAGLFKCYGFPFRLLTDFRPVEKYNTNNAAIVFDAEEVMQSAKVDPIVRINLKKFLKAEVDTYGLGFFDENFSRVQSRTAA